MITTLNFNIIFHSMISMETGNQHKILMDVECCLSQNQMCCLCCVYEVHFKTEVKFALHYPDPPSNFVVATCLYFVVTINTPTTCQSYDCLYVVGCTKCPYQYIGKAVGRKLTTRWGEHRRYVNRKQLDKTTGEHFNRTQCCKYDLPGWSSVWTRTQNI